MLSPPAYYKYVKCRETPREYNVNATLCETRIISFCSLLKINNIPSLYIFEFVSGFSRSDDMSISYFCLVLDFFAKLHLKWRGKNNLFFAPFRELRFVFTLENYRSQYLQMVKKNLVIKVCENIKAKFN